MEVQTLFPRWRCLAGSVLREGRRTCIHQPCCPSSPPFLPTSCKCNFNTYRTSLDIPRCPNPLPSSISKTLASTLRNSEKHQTETTPQHFWAETNKWVAISANFQHLLKRFSEIISCCTPAQNEVRFIICSHHRSSTESDHSPT